MKKIKCSELGGACDLVFEANTFEEMVELSKQHGMEMFMKQDTPHIEAITKMQEMMQTPEAVGKWLAEMKTKFEALPEA